VAPLFENWLAPLADLGAATVTNESTSSTDHAAFDRVGVPGFQFIQDGLDYRLRTHHTNLDTYERLHREDLIQSSAVLSTFVLHTANRDDLLPRKPMPQKPLEKPKKEKAETASE
jgi:Zn-dependent M28 family amino/carboxypeptidase